MTDTPSTDTGKTTAEREAEARTRLRAERNPHSQEQRHDPNQPEGDRWVIKNWKPLQPVVNFAFGYPF